METVINIIGALIRLKVWKAAKKPAGDILWAQQDLKCLMETYTPTKKQSAYISVQVDVLYTRLLSDFGDIFDKEDLFSQNRSILLEFIYKSYLGTFPFTYWHHQPANGELPYTNDVLELMDFMDLFDIPIKAQREAIKFWKETARQFIDKRSFT